MSTDTLDNLSDADVPGSTNCMIRPISHSMEQQGQPFLRPRNASDLIAQHPELVANLMASLNPTPPPLAHDVLLFQSAQDFELKKLELDQKKTDERLCLDPRF